MIRKELEFLFSSTDYIFVIQNISLFFIWHCEYCLYLWMIMKHFHKPSFSPFEYSFISNISYNFIIFVVWINKWRMKKRQFAENGLKICSLSVGRSVTTASVEGNNMDEWNMEFPSVHLSNEIAKKKFFHFQPASFSLFQSHCSILAAVVRCVRLVQQQQYKIYSFIWLEGRTVWSKEERNIIFMS